MCEGLNLVPFIYGYPLTTLQHMNTTKQYDSGAQHHLLFIKRIRVAWVQSNPANISGTAPSRALLSVSRLRTSTHALLPYMSFFLEQMLLSYTAA